MRITNKFWWGMWREKIIHLLATNSLARALWKGGLGLRNLRIFNDVMLAKQVWRMFFDPKSLLSQLIMLNTIKELWKESQICIPMVIRDGRIFFLFLKQ